MYGVGTPFRDWSIDLLRITLYGLSVDSLVPLWSPVILRVFLLRVVPVSFLLVLAVSGMAREPRLETGAGMSGFGFYDLDTWGVVRSRLSNPADDDAETLVAVQFKAMPTVQYASEAWLPPRSERVVLTPVRPIRAGTSSNAFEASAQLIARDGSGRERSVATTDSLLLRLANPVVTAAAIDHRDDTASRVLAALRESSGLKPSATFVNSRSAPLYHGAWDAVDALLLADPDLQLDSAQIAAMRQWVFDGGRLWVMLDKADPLFAARLLGEAWNVVEIDRVPVTDFSLRFGTDRVEELRFDYPIDFVRVDAPGFEVTHTIDGYPAAMRKRVGEGELIVTTIAGPAWLKPDLTASAALQALNRFVRRNPVDVPSSDEAVGLASYVREQIGYQIISRGPVAGVLGVFTLAILVAGLVLAKRGRLEWLAAAGAGLAVLAAGALIAAGLAQQGQTPTTVAQAQVALVYPEQSMAQVQGLTSVYVSPADAGSDATLSADRGAVIWPDLAAQGGGLLRLVWTDPDRYRLDNLNMPAGAVRSVTVDNAFSFVDPPRAIVGFNADGATVRIEPGSLGVLEDPLIATTSGRLAPRSDAALDDTRETYTATSDDVLGPDQFIRADLLTQTQIARQEVYRDLLRHPFPEKAALLGWAPPLDVGVDYSADATRRGSVVVAIPITFDPPAAGQAVTVPSPFLVMRPFHGARGVASSTIYNDETGSWIDNISQEMSTLMRFDPPTELVPIRLSTATFTFNLKAPGRTWEVITFADGRLRVLASGENAFGLTTIELGADNLPEMTEDGSPILGLRVGPYIDPGTGRAWSVQQMNLTVTGTIPGPTAENPYE